MADSSAEFASPLVERAMRVAALAHRGQARKGSSAPHFSHPASVAMLLIRYGFDEDAILAAALLHDVAEDTEVTLEQLALEFPESVVAIVAALSERKTDEAGHKRPWRDRKTDHIREIESAPLEAKAVALADKLHNMSSVLYDFADCGEAVWDRFNASIEEQFWYHNAMIDAAYADDPRIARLQSACREVLSILREACS